MRAIISIIAGTATALAAAGTLPAQQPAPRRDGPPPARRETPRGATCYSADPERADCRIFLRSSRDSAMMKRAALGLQLSSTGSPRDTIGVFVTWVAPKGPAENAGIFEGDRIASINGVDLRVNPVDAGDRYASDLPSRRLAREVGKLSPGAVVTLRVYSGGRVRDVRVTAARASDLGDSNSFMLGPGGPDGLMLRAMPRMNMENLPRVLLEDLPRMRMEDFPRMRMEDLPRMRLEEFPRMRIEEFPRIRMRLNENGRYRTLEPSRVRVIDPDERTFIYRDGSGTRSSAKSPEGRTKSEKAAAEKAEKARKEKR